MAMQWRGANEAMHVWLHICRIYGNFTSSRPIIRHVAWRGVAWCCATQCGAMCVGVWCVGVGGGVGVGVRACGPGHWPPGQRATSPPPIEVRALKKLAEWPGGVLRADDAG